MRTVTDAEARSALDAVAAATGLTIDAAFGPEALRSLQGPFITRQLGPDGGALLCVAVRDSLAAGIDDLCEALAQAVTDGDGAPSATPVATGAELAARFAGPFEVAALGDGVDIHAVVVTAVERRGAEGPAAAAGSAPVDLNAALGAATLGAFDKLANVALDVSVELGRTRVTLSEVLEYDVGSVVELDRAAGAPVDIRVNGTLLAHGEVVLIDDEYAVRITAIVEPGSE